MRSRRGPARFRSVPLAVQLERNKKAMRDLERMAIKPKVPIEQRELGREELDWDGREKAK